MSRQRYYLSIADLAAAQGDDPQLAFQGRSPSALATAVRLALRTQVLFERWRAKQDEPDKVDPKLGAVDEQAEAEARQADLKVELDVATDLPMEVLRQRLNLLIGENWQLHDVR